MSISINIDTVNRNSFVEIALASILGRYTYNDVTSLRQFGIDTRSILNLDRDCANATIAEAFGAKMWKQYVFHILNQFEIVYNTISTKKRLELCHILCRSSKNHILKGDDARRALILINRTGLDQIAEEKSAK